MNISHSLLNLIANQHGPSFYLLDSDRFQKNFHRLLNSFRTYYPRTTIAYSYKTNYVPRYCKIVEEMGGYAEVVSSMEMLLALKLGIPAYKVFFNGPYKEHGHVIDLLCAGGTVNVDSWEELERIAGTADTHTGEPFKLGLRCNFDVQDGVLSRFGFDVLAESFEKAIAMIDMHPKLKLVGLHCHFANRSLDCWRNRTKGMISIIDKFFKHRLQDIQHVSLGGGIFGYMSKELKEQFPVEIPEFEDYAQVAAKPFYDYFTSQDEGHLPTLIIEPGTALVVDAMKYVCTVNSIKTIRGQTIVSMTGSSYNINPNPNRKNLPIEIFSKPSASEKISIRDANLGGYTCIEGDYLYKGFNGVLAIGDYIVFHGVGSYSVVMKPPFILPNVAIVEPLEAGGWSVIKRGEEVEDIFGTYQDSSIL